MTTVAEVAHINSKPLLSWIKGPPIRGLNWADHAFDRLQERGIGVFEVFCALAEPDIVRPGKKNERSYIRGDIRVVFDEKQKTVITAIDTMDHLRRTPRVPLVPPIANIPQQPQPEPQMPENTTGVKTGLIDLVREFAHAHKPLERFTQAAFRILYPEWSKSQVREAFARLTRRREICIARTGRCDYEYFRPAEVEVTVPEAPAEKKPKVHIEHIIAQYLEDWPIGEDRTVERVRQDIADLGGVTHTTARESFRKYGTKLGKVQNLSERGQPGKYRRTAFKATISNIKVTAVPVPVIEQEPETMPAETPDTTSQSQAAITYAPDFLALPYGEWRRLPDEVEIAIDKIELRDGSVIEAKFIRWPKPE